MIKISTTFYKQLLLTVLLVVSFQDESFSQTRYNARIKSPGLFIGFNGGPFQSQINNEGTLAGTGFTSKKMDGYFGSFEIGYFFSKVIGLLTGIGYSSHKTQLNLDTYQTQFYTTDSENETYQRQEGSNIEEVQDVGFLIVPFSLHIRIPFSKSFGFFVQPGVNVAIPMTQNYTSSGTFTFKGYYPAYNVLLENLPEYGFPSNVNSVTNGTLELEPYNLNGTALAGFDLYVQKSIQIAVAAFYSRSLSNISAYKSSDQFQLSSDVNQINSFMGGSSNVKIESMGIQISLRFYMKRHI